MNCISIFAALRDALGHLLGEARSFTLRTYTAVGCLSGDKGARCLMTVHIGTKTNNLVLTPA